MTRSVRPRGSRTRVQWGLIWALLLALVVHGQASAVLQLLGPTHRHDAAHAHVGVPLHDLPAATPATRVDRWLQAAQAWYGEVRLRSHAADPFAQGHRHGAFGRHHHDVGDTSVVALDAGKAAGAASDNGAAAGSAGGASLPLALACSLILPEPAPRRCAWPPAPTRAWASAIAERLDRPPRA